MDHVKGHVQVHTNMVFVDAGPAAAQSMPEFFRSKGIIIFGRDPLRLVTHLDINSEDVEIVIQAFKEFYADGIKNVGKNGNDRKFAGY